MAGAARSALVVLLLSLLVVAASAGTSAAPPPAQPGLLVRTLGKLLGWRGASELGPPPAGNVTAVVDRFRSRLFSSVAVRLQAARSVRLSPARRQYRRARRSPPEQRTHPQSLPEPRMALDRDEHGVDVLLKDKGVEEAWEIPAAGAQHVHVFEDQNRTYALAAFERSSNTSWLYELMDGTWTARTNISTFGAVEFTSFEHEGDRHVIAAEFDCGANRADKRGSVLYLFAGGQLRYKHVLPAARPTDVAVWNDYDTLHIGVSSESERTADGGVNYHVNSSIFKWTDGNFRHHALPTHGARDIEHFRIHSHVFLAVANHRNNDGSLNVQSEVLRYSLGTGQYRTFQRLPTHGAVRFRYFSWGEGVAAEHFLAVANQADRGSAGEEINYRVSSVIYKFSRSQFVPFQCIPTVRARDILPVWGGGGEFVLAVLDDDGLALYQYTGWRFALVTRVPAAAPGAAEDGDGRLSAFTHGGDTYLTVGGVAGERRFPVVYRLQFGRRRDVHALHEGCASWCAGLRERLADLQPRADSLRARLQRAPRVDQPLQLASLRVRSEPRAHFSAVTVDNVRLRPNVTLNSGLLERLTSLNSRLEFALSTLGTLRQRLVGAVSAAGRHAFTQPVTVTGAWHLNTAVLRRLRVRALNGVPDVPALLAGLVYTDRPLRAPAARLALARLHLQTAASLTAGTLSHLHPASFVTLTGHHVITASKLLSGHVTSADLRSELVNGVGISPDTVLVQGVLPDGAGSQFGTLSVTELDVRYISGRDVRQILQRAVSASDGTQFTGAVYFAGPVSIASARIRSVNGVLADRLLQRAFTTAGGQSVTGAWTIGRLHVKDDLTLTGTLGGVRVPDELVLISRPELSYHLRSLAFSSVAIGQLTVTDRLGPVRVFDGKLQLLLASGDDQLVVARKTVGSLRLAANSTVSGTVNGVSISGELLETALEQSATTIASDRIIRGDVILQSDVRLTGLLGGVDVPGLLRVALKLRDTTLPNMTLTQLQISGDARTSRLSGVAPSEWVTAAGSGDRLITGRKAVLALSAAELTVDLLNGLQLDELYGSVLRTEGEQLVRGPLLFAHHTVFDRVVANSVVWEEYSLMEEGVTVAGSHVITGTKLFSAPLHVADLHVSDLWLDGLVDGVNVTALLARSAAATNTSHMTVTGSQTFSSRVTAATLLVTGSVNGARLLDDLSAAARHALVTGQLAFDAPVTVHRLTYGGEFDGAPAAELGSDWLTSAGGQTVSGALRLSGPHAVLTAAALTVLPGARLNGRSGDALLQGRVRLDQHVTIRQNVTIASLAAADVTLQMSGMNFTDVMRQNRSQLVLGGKVLVGGTHALSRLTVAGTVNGLRLDELCRRVVLADAAASFAALTVTGSVTLHGAVDPLLWTVSGLAVRDVERRYWLRDGRQTLTGRVTLPAPRFTALRHVQTLLSGPAAVPVDLVPYLTDYWSLSRPQTVTGAVTFLADVTLSALTARALTVRSLDGHDLSSVRDTALTVTGGSVTGPHWMLPDLIVTGPVWLDSLSGTPASALLRTAAREARFTGHQRVRHVLVIGDVTLPAGGAVYRLDVSQHLHPGNFLSRRPSGTALLAAGHAVFGWHTVTLTRPLTVHGTVGGVRLLPDAVMTLTGQQRVPAVTWLSQVDGACLRVPQLQAVHLLNRVNLNTLIERAVRTSALTEQDVLPRPLLVTGHWTFERPPAALRHAAADTDAEQRVTQLLRQELEAVQWMGGLDQTAVASEHLVVLRDIYRALQDARGRLRRASYLQYYVSVQRWASDIVRLLPVFLDSAADGGGSTAPAFLVAIRPDSVQLLHWRAAPHAHGGRWEDGARYPERRVAGMAGLRRADGTAHVAQARLAEPPPGADVPDRVYRWDDPVLRRLGGAVNYIFLYHRDVLTQSLAMPSHNTADVQSLQPSPEHDCFLFVHFTGNGSHLVCYSAAQRSFLLHQTLETYRARQASVYSAGSGSVCAAVAGGARVDLWCWDSARELLVRRQTIAAAAVGVSAAQFHGRTLLAVTISDTGKQSGLVHIYCQEPGGARLTHLQTAPVWAARSVRLLVLPSDQLILACLTAGGRARYLLYRGRSGFERHGTLAVGHAAALDVYNMPGLATQLAVAGRPRGDPLLDGPEHHYPAAVLAGKFMGHEW